jgi:hypothetical protein
LKKDENGMIANGGLNESKMKDQMYFDQSESPLKEGFEI